MEPCDQGCHPGVLRLLISALKLAGYEWLPQPPDRLLAFRKQPATFRPLVQWLGLGLPVAERDLVDDGIPPQVLEELKRNEFTSASVERITKSRMALSGSGDLFVVHDHWPPEKSRSGGYVHFGAESAWLGQACNRDLEGFIGRRVLDLGCSSGALALEVGGVAQEVLGIDISARSIVWARALAKSYGFNNVRYEVAEIGKPEADAAAGAGRWDVAVINPPMMVPAPDVSNPHRDGGALGIELPLLFLDFCSRHLTDAGEVHTLVTNPIVNGRSVFFERLQKQSWEILEKDRIHSHFNQAVARKQGYEKQGIERIELWHLHLQKNS